MGPNCENGRNGGHVVGRFTEKVEHRKGLLPVEGHTGTQDDEVSIHSRRPLLPAEKGDKAFGPSGSARDSTVLS